MGKVTNDDLIDVDSLIKKDVANGNVVDVNSLIANGSISVPQKKNLGGNDLNQPSQLPSQSQSEDNKIPLFDLPTELQDISKGKFAGEEPVTLSPTQLHGVIPKVSNKLPNIKDAIESETNKRLREAYPQLNKEEPQHILGGLDKEREDIKQGVIHQYQQGSLVPEKDAYGNSIMREGTGLIKSFTNALTQSHQQSLENNFLFNADKKTAIEYLNRTMTNPETGIVKEPQGAPSGISGATGELLGENIELIEKGAIGTEALALTGLTGGESFGAFLAMAKELAQGGYSQTLINNYRLLKQQNPEISDDEAYDKSRNIALGGEAANLVTGAILSKSATAKIPEPQVIPSGVIGGLKQSAEHALKTAPKVIGTQATATALTDVLGITQGVHKDLNDILSDVGEAAKSMTAMHFGLWGLTEVGRIPSYIRPQIENYVASAPRGEVAEFYSKAEANGIVPEGTSAKVANKLAQFDEQKKVVEDLPIPEENKAAIAGKLIQKGKLQEQKEALTGHGEAFKSRIEELDKQIEDVNTTINQLYNAKNIFKVEQKSQHKDVTATTEEEPKKEETKVIQPQAGEGTKTSIQTTKEAISKLTPEQRIEFARAKLKGQGDEYLKRLSTPNEATVNKVEQGTQEAIETPITETEPTKVGEGTQEVNKPFESNEHGRNFYDVNNLVPENTEVEISEPNAIFADYGRGGRKMYDEITVSSKSKHFNKILNEGISYHAKIIDRGKDAKGARFGVSSDNSIANAKTYDDALKVAKTFIAIQERDANSVLNVRHRSENKIYDFSKQPEENLPTQTKNTEEEKQITDLEEKRNNELHEANKPVIELERIPNKEFAQIEDADKIKQVKDKHTDIFRRKKILDKLIDCL